MLALSLSPLLVFEVRNDPTPKDEEENGCNRAEFVIRINIIYAYEFLNLFELLLINEMNQCYGEMVMPYHYNVT